MLLLQNSNHAAVRSEDAPYPHTPTTTGQHPASSNDDISPRAHKRRRADSGTSHSISAADQQELCDFLLKNLPYSAGTSAVARLQCSTTSRDERGQHRPMANISDVYSLAHEKMLVSIPPSSDGKYQTLAPSEYGPYHAQYWSLLENNLDAGVPQAANGGYQSPYGSIGPEVYFPAVADQSTNTYAEANQHHNGYDHPDGSAYTLGRNTPYTASLSAEAVNVYPSPVDTFNWNYFSSSVDANQQHLSTLDNLATQMLHMLLSCSTEDVAATLLTSNSANGQAFANLESMFEQAAGQFPHEHSNTFIDVEQMQTISTSALSAIRRANLATFTTSVFRGRDIPFMELNAAFLDIFMPTGTDLLKTEASLFLEFKTQAYMAIAMSHNYSRETLDRLFPRDLQLTILRRRAEPPHLAPSEQDFISRLNTRRQYLLACSDSIEALSQLHQKYSWNDFLGDLRICVSRALENLDRNKAASAGASPSVDPITKAALAAHVAISGHEPGPMHSYHSSSLHMSNHSGHKRKRSSPNSDSSLSPQSPHAPMHLQYRNGHPQGTSKPRTPYPTIAQRRLPNAPSARRPWTPEEEKALMDGLERVKGPHWSQILALYGAGGSISEILKDRNQVQLKDKARNLKLFFLKSGLEVPHFLQKVTGELKTRAPAQAAKLEARQRLKRLEGSSVGR